MPFSTMSPMVVMFRSRTGRVIMPAWQNRQPRVQPRKISTQYRSCTVSASGTSGFFGYGQASRSITVCFAVRHGTPGRFGATRLIRPSARYSTVKNFGTYTPPDAASRCSTSSRPPGRPSAFHSRITSEMASTISSPSPSTAASMKSAIGSGLNAECPPASTIGSSSPRSTAYNGIPARSNAVSRFVYPSSVENDTPNTSKARTGRCASSVNCGYAVVPHHPLHVRPHGVRALGQDPVALVQHLVQDLHALVRQPDLVRVRVHQRPADLGGVPVLRHRVELTADVLDRLLHARQQGLQAGEQ